MKTIAKSCHVALKQNEKHKIRYVITCQRPHFPSRKRASSNDITLIQYIQRGNEILYH